MVQYSDTLDLTFAAVADPTRRGILARLTRSEATISELAADFEMTLTGIAKHVRVLEHAELVSSTKKGRVRHCRVGPRRLESAAAWIAVYQTMLEERFDALDAFLARDAESRVPPTITRDAARSREIDR